MFEEFPKIARLSRECVVTEKIDGTNASVWIDECHLSDEELATADCGIFAGHILARRPGYPQILRAGSRTQFITPERDNHGFAAWAKAHANEFWALGFGRHYGEWWGSGIQRGYGLTQGEKRFSLFNVARWADERDREKFPTDRPACCSVVPVLYRGEFDTFTINGLIETMRAQGSAASPGFTKPEGVVIWHEAARLLFKKTLEKDAEGKEQRERRLAHTSA